MRRALAGRRTYPCSIGVIIVDRLGSKLVEGVVLQLAEKLSGKWGGDVGLEIIFVVRTVADEGGH